nr:E3 ubiquitin-protein ligase MARCH8 [Ipomoea batatas]
MQRLSIDSIEDNSETKPILLHSQVIEGSEEFSSLSIEITESGDCSTSAGDCSSIEVDGSQLLLHSEQPLCRICLDTEGEDLIAPCRCKGTQKYVHRSCLDNWRSTKVYYFIFTP